MKSYVIENNHIAYSDLLKDKIGIWKKTMKTSKVFVAGLLKLSVHSSPSLSK